MERIRSLLSSILHHNFFRFGPSKAHAPSQRVVTSPCTVSNRKLNQPPHSSARERGTKKARQPSSLHEAHASHAPPPRWQGGIEADEARRKALADYTRFTGIHRGAQTLEVTAPTGGWASDASEIAYADRYSRREAAIVSSQEPSVLLGHDIPPEEATLP